MKHRKDVTRTSGRLALTAAALALAVPAAGLLTAAPAAAAGSDIVSVASGTRATAAQQLLDMINAHRRAKGLAPVKYSATVSGIAQGESDRLVRQEVINHTNTFLQDSRAGGWDAAGEIHAVSWQGTVTELMQWWKGSTAHNKVLTDPRMEVIGIGLTYVDGALSGNKQGWRLVGTVTSYGYPTGGAPADARTTVGTTAPQAFTGYGVRGAIGAQYRALGGAPVFGTPTMNERGGLVNGGVYQSFSRKHTFYWSPATGAWPVNFGGAIGQKFIAHRHENGFGYPTSRERGGLVDGGAYQSFRNGGTVYKLLWSARSGAHAVQESGAIGGRWKAAGYERGYGYPTTDEYRWGTEVRQQFSNGHTVHWSTVTRQTWVTR